MKKLVFTLLALTAAFVARAQYAVGDPYEKDGVKAIVVHVNEDGSNGLILRLEEERSKEEIKIQRAEAKAKKKETDKKVVKEQNEAMLQERKEHMLAVCDRLTENGRENFETIERYCRDNGVDMEQIFPDFAWAKAIGDGWFIPGDAELEKIYSFISHGYGKENKFTTKEMKGLLEQIRSNSGYENCVLPGFYRNGMPLQSYKSSTWTQSTDNEREKLNGIQPHCSVLYNSRSMGNFSYWFVLQTGHLSQRAGNGLATMFIKENIPLYKLWNQAKHVAVSEF